jgi:multidrug efflux pump subunit AcrA (membrane-fusion protein)
VLEGLKSGEQVIVDNLVRLRPGMPVQTKKAG